MKPREMDELHDMAIDEDFSRDVADEIMKISRANVGRRAEYARVMANAAFWIRVYDCVTDGDPMALVAVVDLARRLNVGLVDQRMMN